MSDDAKKDRTSDDQHCPGCGDPSMYAARGCPGLVTNSPPVQSAWDAALLASGKGVSQHARELADPRPSDATADPDAPFSTLTEKGLSDVYDELQSEPWNDRKLAVLTLIAEVRYLRKRVTDYDQLRREAMVWRAVATGFRLALSDTDDDGTEALEHALEHAQTAFNDAVHAHGHPSYPGVVPGQKRGDDYASVSNERGTGEQAMGGDASRESGGAIPSRSTSVGVDRSGRGSEHRRDPVPVDVMRANELLARSHGLLEMQDRQPTKLLAEIATHLGWDRTDSATKVGGGT